MSTKKKSKEPQWITNTISDIVIQTHGIKPRLEIHGPYGTTRLYGVPQPHARYFTAPDGRHVGIFLKSHEYLMPHAKIEDHINLITTIIFPHTASHVIEETNDKLIQTVHKFLKKHAPESEIFKTLKTS